jgi:hypothetical protein
MYCSSCGVAVAQGLSYCNYCGASLVGGRSDEVYDQSEVKPGFLVFAMIAVFVFGLVAITLLLGMMKAIIQMDTGAILGFAVLCFLIMLALEGVFIRLLFRRKHRTGGPGDTVQLKGQSTKELDAAHAGALPEPVASVTEHTTRAFAPIYTERTSK